MRDFYEILEVDRKASFEEIKRSYKKLVKKYHPDFNPGDEEAEKKIKEINIAYEVLSDDTKRKQYDMYGEDGLSDSFQGGGFGGFSDIFGDIFDMFGGGFRDSYTSRRTDAPIKGSDIQYDITIDFRDAVFGVEKEINIRVEENCHKCNGSGAEPGTSKHTCSKCNGTGQVRIQTNSPFGRVVRVVTCDECNGTGEVFEKKCSACHGVGKEVVNKKIKIKIPAGVDNNTIMTMREEGNVGSNGGPKGDLYIYISVRPDTVFKRSGLDLHIDIPISYVDATLGGKIKVPTLKNLVDYDIPSGTQGGTTFKIKGEGVKKVNSNFKGDLYFTVSIIIPKKVTEEQKKVLEQLRGVSNDHEEKKGFFEKVKDLFD